jgi:peptidoglycan/LPS O-acetylase OafA/YrhL
MCHSPNAMETNPVERPKLHLAFIDGMRGFAALYVVLHHAFQGSALPYNSQSPLWYYLFAWGHGMVTIFIAISGFCLMLPVVQNGLTLRGGTKVFYKRRAHRILPPYYAVLILAILTAVLSQADGTRVAYLREPSTLLAMGLHFAMIHNWNNATFYALDGPLWSVAVECQIYMFFPLMVLAWRRFGAARTVSGMFFLAYALYYLTGHRGSLHYYFVFALGMAGAEMAIHGKAPRWVHWACGVGLIGYLVTFRGKDYLSDFFIGIFAASLMTILSAGSIARVRKVLSVRAVTFLGSFSYSLYLIHSVIQHIYLGSSIGMRMASDPMKQLAILVFGITPIVLVVAYLFYLVAERPFVNRPKKVLVAEVVPKLHLGEVQQEEAI